MLKIVPFLLFFAYAISAPAQQLDSAASPMRNVELANIDIAPAAIDVKGWLLLDQDIQLELEGAVQNLYNCQHERAEKQFRSLRRRYPQHPLPYLLLGMSTWWKIMPSNTRETRYDKLFFAYMDTAITCGEKLYDADEQNLEACFFLSAAYGFDARLNAERRNWRKATVSSKRALNYLEKSRQANGLSPEFLFGQALMNYYAVWISDNYPLLRPVMLFFPRGNKQLGLQQLRNVAANAFYTGPEAKMFLMKILLNEEANPEAALPVARELATAYPNNAYFQRYYALVCHRLGQLRECERVSLDILAKLSQNQPGYESISGKYAAYFMGRIAQYRYKDEARAKDYYQRSVDFAENGGEPGPGFYLLAHQALAQLADRHRDFPTARRHYAVVLDKAERKSELYQEARTYLQTPRAGKTRNANPAASASAR